MFRVKYITILSDFQNCDLNYVQISIILYKNISKIQVPVIKKDIDM